MRWTHLTVTSTDIDRSIKFYSDYCELKVIRDRRTVGGTTVWLGLKHEDESNPAFVIVIAPCENGAAVVQFDHMGFQCATKSEVDALAARAKEAGILVDGPHDSGGDIGYWLTIKDPDGHIIEFTQGQPISGLVC